MRVKALQKLYYGRQDRHVGEEYDMDDREEGEANILVALGKISIVKSKPPEPKTSEPEQSANKAEDVESMTTEDDSLTPSRRVYRRRDMRAEK